MIDRSLCIDDSFVDNYVLKVQNAQNDKPKFKDLNSPWRTRGISLALYEIPTFVLNSIIFEFKDTVKKYVEELNMNPKLIDRNLNVGFSGGEKKKNEILQMLVLNPKLSILDETDSGLDVDAIRTVSKGIEMYKSSENAVLIITHNMRILENLKVDFVHILVDGKIVKTGNADLAKEIEQEGYEKYKKVEV